MTTTEHRVRLTQFAAGGGCACKVPVGELERVLSGLDVGQAQGDLLVGLENGDDGAVVRIEGGRAVVMTADFFTPVVDDAYDWGRIAAANALSDVYAMGGRPIAVVNAIWADGEAGADDCEVGAGALRQGRRRQEKVSHGGGLSSPPCPMSQ